MKIGELNSITQLYFGYEDIARALKISPASARVSASRYVRLGLLLRLKRNTYLLRELNSAKLLEPLVFGGGTMLRLCHELNRYSVDLDFWFVRETAQKAFFDRLVKSLGN